MGIDNKILMDLASQIGFDNTDSKQTSKASNMANKYKSKSDDELIDEILDMKKAMKKDKAQFEKNLKTIKSLRAMMSGEQKARLEKIIRLLESED